MDRAPTSCCMRSAAHHGCGDTTMVQRCRSRFESGRRFQFSYQRRHAAKERCVLHRLATSAKLASTQKTSNSGRVVFVSCPQARTASRESGLDYDQLVSGRTIYGYVNGNPLLYTDPTGELGHGAAAAVLVVIGGTYLANWWYNYVTKPEPLPPAPPSPGGGYDDGKMCRPGDPTPPLKEPPNPRGWPNPRLTRPVEIRR